MAKRPVTWDVDLKRLEYRDQKGYHRLVASTTSGGGGGGSGDEIEVNGSAATSPVDFNDTTPAAPTSGTIDDLNVKWQTSGSNVSAYVPMDALATLLVTSGSVGTFITVNGGSILTAADLNDTSPSAPGGAVNVLWQESGGAVSAYIASSTLLALTPDLEAIEALTGTGYLTRIAANSWALRSYTSTGGTIALTNPAGVAGTTNFETATAPPVVTEYTTAQSNTAHAIPATHTMMSAEVVGGGGGGGGGRTAATSTARCGGGGGGVGGENRITVPVVGGTTVYVTVGAKGTGGSAGNNGTAGGSSFLSTVSGSTTDYNCILRSDGGAQAGGGGLAGSTVAGSGGSAGLIPTLTRSSASSGRHGVRGTPVGIGGQAGGDGGSATGPTAGVSITPDPGGTTCSGAGGGSCSTGNGESAGGGVSAAGDGAAVTAGTAGGGAGNPGVLVTSNGRWFSTGGSGGGGSAAGTGGKGGDGVRGSGGGGGGGGITGGAGGDGGVGYVRITTW